MKCKFFLVTYIAVSLLFSSLLCSCARPLPKTVKLPEPSSEEFEEVKFDNNHDKNGKQVKKQPLIKNSENSELNIEERKKEEENSSAEDQGQNTNLKGWDRLANILASDGIERKLIHKVFSDPRMPAFDKVTFSINPKESHAMYSIFLDKARLEGAHNFHQQWNQQLLSAEKRFGVPASVITAILYVETGFGKNTGTQIVLNRLGRLANIGEQNNIYFNIKRLQRGSSTVTEQEIKDRAEYLEKTFYPEVLALFRLASVAKIDLIALKGSASGAFGLPQFLPSSYVKYAVDANENGTVSLFEVEDAIFSVGNFLASNGWKKETNSHKEKMDVLWNYNRSDAYGEMILKVAERLE